MILSSKDKVAFVHIPKCGGTSLRSVLEGIKDSRSFNKVAPVDGTGLVDLTHMNLELLRHVYPSLLIELTRCNSYCLVREPVSRFRSSFDQRLRMYRGTTLGKLSESDILREFDIVVNALDGAGKWLPHDFVHFERQKGYIYLDEKRVIKNIFPLPVLERMLSEILKACNAPRTKVSPKNEMLVERRFLSFVRRNFGNEYALQIGKYAPRSVKTAIRTFTHRKPTPFDLPIFQAGVIRDFVDHYYKEDIVLWDRIKNFGGPDRVGASTA